MASIRPRSKIGSGSLPISHLVHAVKTATGSGKVLNRKALALHVRTNKPSYKTKARSLYRSYIKEMNSSYKIH